MKRLMPFLLCLFLLIGCAVSAQNTYHHPAFTASLPASFEPVDTASIVCFAPHGNPQLSSSITFYATEQNWYFDSFSVEEYEDALQTICGYESLSVDQIKPCRVDGFEARRISCKVLLEQGTHDLILYAVNAGQTYFFTLLNRESDDYIAAFDAMMSTIQFTEGK